MAYTILNTDGTTLLLLADGTTDKLATSLTLVGRNLNSYGEIINNNLVRILANSANTSSNPPRSPLKGQLWYDTSSRRLKVYDNGFKNISGSLVSASRPANLSSGDLWFDSANNQLNVSNAGLVYVIGPAFPPDAIDSGWKLPLSPIRDEQTDVQQVLVLKSYGNFIAMASSESFNMVPADATSYFGSANNFEVVSGITINGDIKVYGNINSTGYIMSKQLSASVDINKIATNTATVTVYTEYVYQNDRISAILETMFPVESSLPFNELGLPLDSEARVLCTYYDETSLDNNGLQFRRFKIINDAIDGKSWQPVEIYFADWTSTLTNVINTVQLI